MGDDVTAERFAFALAVFALLCVIFVAWTAIPDCVAGSAVCG